MDCPKCRNAILKIGRFCEHCGNDFGSDFPERFKFYVDLKNEVDRVSAAQNTLSSGLARVSEKLREFEGLLRGDLARSAAGSRPAMASVPTPTPAPLAERKETPPAAVPKPAAPAPSPASMKPVSFAPPAQPKRVSSNMEVQVGQKWLLIVGILTMVFGVGYFLKYSFEQGWVGPAGRVAMAYLWGIAFLVAGDRFREKFERFGLSLIGGGVAVLYFSAFAAFQIYHLFGQTASFSVMVMITALACALSIRYDQKWLAVLGLVGGFLTPVLLSTGQDNQIALMTYMTVLNLGLLSIAFHRKWDLLNGLGFFFTWLLYSAWYMRFYEDAKFWPAILFLNIFFLIYAVVPFVSQVRSGGRSDGREFVLMGLNSLLAFGYSYVMIKGAYGTAWVSVISVLYAAVFLGLATYLYQTGRQELDAFVVMLAKAMLFLVVTVPVLFSKHWITVFWSAQGLALLWMAVRLERRSLAAGAYALLVVSAIKFLFYDYDSQFHVVLTERGFHISAGYTFLIVERYVTSAVLLLSLFLSGMLARQAPSEARLREQGDAPLLFILFGVVLFIVLTAETASFFHDYLPQARFAAISVLWTLFSVTLMLLGFRRNTASLRKISFGLFLVTVLKVFLFDMANVSTPYRIISFIILGMVLVGTSYLYYRHKDRIIEALAESDGGGRN
jgi:uncharacterized membrane protein